ncbi:DUF2325 domain-containing protein [Nitrosospira sp. NRS527]|uniref:DUF2325 domain-containing protein n=1 Tax=Nitrosospira sp. NRS527 TaxID=155925 RepID=UPI001AFA62ED|nr:DUF2325 domain-containing protein [Nitrosospira sp. NRS527]BCT66915.1 hypothetical protein NNRS527_00490 [Nitrosospira sp. NRS527]
MTALIIGGDYIETLRRELLAHGLRRVEHWDGRQPRVTRRAIPVSARLVVILHDYVSHGVSNALKQQAYRRDIPLVFCRSSTHDLRQKLERLELAESPCRDGYPIGSEFMNGLTRWHPGNFTGLDRIHA